MPNRPQTRPVLHDLTGLPPNVTPLPEYTQSALEKDVADVAERLQTRLVERTATLTPKNAEEIRTALDLLEKSDPATIRDKPEAVYVAMIRAGYAEPEIRSTRFLDDFMNRAGSGRLAILSIYGLGRKGVET